MQDKILSLYVFTFEGQYVKFFVHMLLTNVLTCILYSDARAGCFGRYVLQVAGCGLKFNYNCKTAGTWKNIQAVDLP